MIGLLLLALALDTAYFANPVVTGHLARGLEEASGMVASKQHPGLFWIHNDSGDGPVIYAIDSTGRRMCAYEFTSDDVVRDGSDWEDIAYSQHISTADTSYYIWVGDIGDNEGKRDAINIYRMREGSNLKCVPTAKLSTPQPFSALRRSFAYPDGPRDAETLLFDPFTNDLYIVSKRDLRNRVYRVPKERVRDEKHDLKVADTLVFVIDLPFFSSTGGDISSDGREILIKTYTHVYRWLREPNETLVSALARKPDIVNYVPEPQGEAICFNASGAGFYTVSEAGSGGTTAALNYYGRAKAAPEQFLTIARNRKRPSEYTIHYKLENQTPVVLSVHNELMMTVKTLVDEQQKPGAHKHTVDMSAATPGTYVVVLRHGAFYNAVPFTVSVALAPGSPRASTAKRKRKKSVQK